MMCRKYTVAYSHKGILGKLTIQGVDTSHAIRNVRARLDARFGKANYTFHGVNYAGKPKGSAARSRPTIARHWPTPPDPTRGQTSNYAAIEKYGARQLKS